MRTKSPFPYCAEVQDLAFRKEPILLLEREEPVAEEWLLDHRLPETITDWVTVYAALHAYLVEQECGPKSPVGAIAVSINGSSRQLAHPQLRPLFFQIAQTCQDQGRTLMVEWIEFGLGETESALVLETLRRVHGAQIVIDDVGANGADSIWRIIQTKPDWIKIDGPFFQRAITDSWVRDVLSHIIEMARKHQVRCIVEWIETEEQKKFAMDLGTEYGQGFLWQK